jgi:indole-3-glycerol phosphate synthase
MVTGSTNAHRIAMPDSRVSVLDEIFAHKRQEVAARQASRPLRAVMAQAERAAPARDFVAALRGSRCRPALIAEIKRASPSRGPLAPGLDPTAMARLYAENGAAAISVLTDERYFAGSLDDLAGIASLSGMPPLLRKDFICDPYQVYEARAAGADAILLIVAHLSEDSLRELQALAEELGMSALVEVHDRAELEVALRCGARLIGVNNRDLRTFIVDSDTVMRLRPAVPAGVCLVAESGIHSAADVRRLASAGVDAVLVGEVLVTAPDVAAAVRSLAGGGQARGVGA